MSHRAVNWALEREDLKPAPWIVLIKLADRHNKDTLRIDPEQSLLAADCNMSRATLNRHLDDLEALGLILRVPRINPKTNKQLNTFYILELDFKNPPHVENAVSNYETRIEEIRNGNISGCRVSNSDTGAVSQKTAIPCLKKADSRVSKRDTNQVKEPVKKPIAAGAAQDPDFDFSGFFAEFIETHPRIGDIDVTDTALRAAIEEGAEPLQILAGARAYAAEQEGNARRYIAYSENWIAKKRWQKHATSTAPRASEEDILRTKAQPIIRVQEFLCTSISDAEARRMVERDIVTADQCRAVGIKP